MIKTSEHTFHIPVLGIGYSIDAPVKVARYGISSVVSLTDPVVIEKMRKFHCEKENEPYTEIKGHDKAAERTTAYLNLLHKIVKKQFDTLKQSAFEEGSDIVKYFEMLPETSTLKQAYLKLNDITDPQAKSAHEDWLRSQMKAGSIDVNIMTKLDSARYAPDGSQLPHEFNDAHAALRGYANSDLDSSIVFSAGMNPRLFSYIEQFPDFYPDANGHCKKRIILKVSDYRSALIQGKILAKKGLWISEFRIESGLNCGGHAFATDGYLLGPILEEFKKNRQGLYAELLELYKSGIAAKNIAVPENLQTLITVQGGVGTAEEHNFLLRYYGMDSIGWGSPFLLVQEVMNIDDHTVDQLTSAGEEAFFMSNASPLGIKFNNFHPLSTIPRLKAQLAQGNPGFPCIKKVLVSDTTYTEKPICTASKQYMKFKMDALEKENLTPEEKERALNKMIERNCLCMGLSTTTLRYNNIPEEVDFVTICPGPNLAYFNKKATLREMVDHIYGRISIMDAPHRPNMFMKEISLYIEHLKEKIEENKLAFSEKNRQYLANFRSKMQEGIDYYHKLIPELKEESEKTKEKMVAALRNFEATLNRLQLTL